MFQAGEVQTNIQLTNTYKVIIKSPVILEQVNEKLNLNMTAQALTKKINVANEKDSQVISVTAEDKDPKVARDVANATADVFKGEVAKIMNVDNVTVLSKAEVAENQSPIKPRPMLNVAIAFVVGLMASVGLAFLLEYLDNTVKKEEDVENLLGLPVLGIVARMDEETMNVKSHAPSSRKVRDKQLALNLFKKKNHRQRRQLIAHQQPKSPISEQYRNIRTNVEFAAVDTNLHSLMVTSANPSEGKTTTTANMAVVFAQQGKKVLLIDADMRKPAMHQMFQVDNIFGLTNVLTHSERLEKCVQTTSVDNLHF